MGVGGGGRVDDYVCDMVPFSFRYGCYGFLAFVFSSLLLDNETLSKRVSS